MKLRCDLHVNGGARKLVLVPSIHETDDHLALKLGAYLLFWDFSPIVEASARHPALLDQEFRPDLLATDAAGSASLWVECGKVTQHKLKKVARRFPRSRLVVIKASEVEARRCREDSDRELGRRAPFEIWGWPGAAFDDWLGCLRDRTEIFGESQGRMINVVVNERPFVAELSSF